MNPKDFFIIRTTNEEQNDFIITIGKHLATEQHFKTREEAEEYKETPKWDLVLAMLAEIEEQKSNKVKEEAKQVVDHIIEKAK